MTILAPIPVAQASRAGSVAAAVTGGYVGGRIAARVAPNSPEARIAGTVLGSVLAERAYQRYEANRQNQSAKRLQHYAGYEDWAQQQSPDELQQQTAREYAEFKSANEKKFSDAQHELTQAVKNLQKSEDPAFICAAICGGWQQFNLIAEPLVTSGRTAAEASSQMQSSCSQDKIFFDAISSNDEGTNSISLKQSQNICFLNQIKNSTVGEMLGSDSSVHLQMALTDIKAEGNGHMSPRFINEVLASFDVDTLFSVTNGQVTTDQVKSIYEQHRADVEKAFHSLEIVKDGRLDGLTILETQDKSPRNYVSLRIQKNEDGETIETVSMPMTVEHKCGGQDITEFHRIKAELKAKVQDLRSKILPSDELVDLTIKNLSYSESDPDIFCSKK